MFTGDQIAKLFVELGVTHVVTVPDSTIGQWDGALSSTPELRVIRVCREGEAWGIAGGLHLGGKVPMVLIQCTGLFESGDALRNIVHDWKLPIMSMIGYRSYLNQSTLPGDTSLVFTEPVLDAWQMPYMLVTDASEYTAMRDHYLACRTAGTAGCALVAEGKA